MENALELIRARRSVRTFDGQRLSGELRDKLLTYAAQADNPYGIPLEFRLLDAAEQKLKCPVVTGTEEFLAAKLDFAPHMEEAFGYSFERVLLYTQSLGLGGVIVAGTMDREGFEQAMALGEQERMLFMSPLGVPAAKMSLRESMMRKGVKADSRLPFSTLFFDGDFSHPLTPEAAGDLREILEAVRLAPSAVNRQPWRVVIQGTSAHFFERQNKGYVSERNGDMQKIDLGIALAHFSLAAEALGHGCAFSLADPGLEREADTQYIASFTLD